MKTLSKLRFILLLVLCAVGGKGWAEGETPNSINEYFTNFPKGNNAVSTTYKGWTYGYAEYLPQLPGLRVDEGTLQSPKIAVNGNAEVSFMYANANKTNKDLKFTLTIKDGDKIIYTKTSGIVTIDYTSTERPIEKVTFYCVSSDVTIEISKTGSNGLFLLYVKVDPKLPVDLALEESEQNASILSANASLLANVTVGRTFPANTWCTLCLPFDVTTAMVREACNQTEDPKLRVFSSVEDQTLKFTAPSNGTVSAGTPFLLNLATAVTSSPVFSNVTISKTDNDVTPAATVTCSDCSFTGTYSPKEIDTNETTADLFLNSSGQFCRPTTEGSKILAGLRAYITVPVSVASGARMKLSIENDDMATGIETLTLSPSHDGTLYTPGIGVNSTATVYTLTGHTAAKRAAKGINIVRSQDGRVRKTVTK